MCVFVCHLRKTILLPVIKATVLHIVIVLSLIFPPSKVLLTNAEAHDMQSKQDYEIRAMKRISLNKMSYMDAITDSGVEPAL